MRASKLGKSAMKHAAIYARFSTDLQDERSIEDQVILCRKYAERGLNVVAVLTTAPGRAGPYSAETVCSISWTRLASEAIVVQPIREALRTSNTCMPRPRRLGWLDATYLIGVMRAATSHSGLGSTWKNWKKMQSHRPRRR